jgi:ligand-binding sensor domain-containing protein
MNITFVNVFSFLWMALFCLRPAESLWARTDGFQDGATKAPGMAAGMSSPAMNGNKAHLMTATAAGWTNAGLSDLQIALLAHNEKTLFASTAVGVMHLSSDGGATWIRNHSFPEPVSMMTDGDSIYVGTRNGNFISNDNGATWIEAHLSVLDVAYSFLARNDAVFIGTPYGVFVSTDNGANWKVTNSGLPDVSVLALAGKGDAVFAGTSGGIYRSADDCAHWTEIDSSIPDIPRMRDVKSLAVCGGTIFAATTGGVFRSTDEGSIWIRSDDGVQNCYVLSFAVAGGNIFAGTWTDGIFVFSESNRKWINVNSGLGNTFVLSMTAYAGYLFAGTQGGGVWRRPLSEMVGVSNPPFPRNSMESATPTVRAGKSAMTFSFTVLKKNRVIIKIYNPRGREISTLVDKVFAAGSHTVEGCVGNAARGKYIAKISVGNRVFFKNIPALR